MVFFGQFVACGFCATENPEVSVTSQAAIILPPATPKGGEIYQLSEGKYVAQKIIPFKNSGGTVDARGDAVYFILEKLTPETKPFWEGFCDFQQWNTRGYETDADTGSGAAKNKKSIAINEGVFSFKQSLDLLMELSPDIWIAYATRKNPTEERTEIGENGDQTKVGQVEHQDIEMAFSVFLNGTTPITTHMGIFRSAPYFKYDKKPHVDLAMQLHAFSGAASKTIPGNAGNERLYMVTRPTKEMASIMRESFQKAGLNELIFFGSSKDREPFRIQVKNEKAFARLLAFEEKHDLAQLLSGPIEFNFTEEQKRMMFDKNARKITMFKGMKEYLAAHSSGELIYLLDPTNITSQEPWFAELNTEDTLGFERRSIFSDLNRSGRAPTTEEEKKAAVQKQLNEYLTTAWLKILEDQIHNDKNSMETKIGQKIFHPGDPLVDVPIDDRDDTMWVINTQHHWQKFLKPDWCKEHTNMRNSIPMAIVDIYALEWFWENPLIIRSNFA